jgi:uncharacterized protein YdbL (DUF1318 family)
MLPLALLLVAACVTINVYFPEAEIQDLSQRIEEEVLKRAEELEGDEVEAEAPAEVEPETGSARSGASLLDTLFGVTPAYADDVPVPEVSNPAIRKIIEARAQRVGPIDRFKAQGVIGESNRGLLETRALDKLDDLRRRADVQKLVRAENADREKLFEEIAAAKNVDRSQIPRIRETYAATLRDNARPGDWIQLPSGEWRQK